MNLNNKREEGIQFMPDFEKRGGILPVVVQDAHTLEILMMASLNPEALQATVDSGMAVFYSTSRKALWYKGAISGAVLKVVEILIDCDQDAFIFIVQSPGQGVCHTRDSRGQFRLSCFYRKLMIQPQLSLVFKSNRR